MTTKTEKSDQTSASVQVDLNLKATELRLGPPGSESPERENLGFLKNLVSGAKRGFNEGGDESKSLNGSAIQNDVGTGSAEKTKAQNHNSSAAVHASNKTQVVGWPPIRSFRKNSMAPNPSKTNVKGDHKMEAGCLYVKVSMDGAPYLRKVDLDTYGSYAELSAALEKMFSCFTIGQYGYNGVPGRDGLCLSGSRLKDLPNSSEQCVLTYEDKDGDWMLVGDVPWDMFSNTCKRIRITKSSEAIGLSPRAMEKCK